MINYTSLKKIGDIEVITNFRNQLISLYNGEFNKAIGCIGGLKTNGFIKYDGNCVIRIK